MPALRTILLGLCITVATTMPASSQQSDRERLVGVWRLISITTHGKVNPLRGGKPTGFLFYTAAGDMGAMIQPERPPIPMKGKTPSGEEAIAALKGFTAYWGTYTVDEKAKIITHSRYAHAQPGYEVDAIRAYRFEGADRIVLGQPGSGNANTWERVK